MPKKERLRIVPLGGLDEIGKNMTVLEYGEDMVVIDAGLMFPDDDHPGVDLILPDYGYILKRAHKLRGIVITHGHEDHTGSLPYLLRDLDRSVPVLGTRLTLGLIESKLKEHSIKKPKLREIKAGAHISLGCFGLDFIPVNHSIPDGVAVLVRTPVGNILHTGDFKFDQTPIDGRFTDFGALTKAGKQGVLLLMSDSTNAENPGYCPPEASVGEALRDIFDRTVGRIIVASFASHIHRIQQVCDAAVQSGRVIVVTGRSMVQNTKIARDLGYLVVDDKNIVDAFDASGVDPDNTVVLCTGSQGEPLSALARIANRDHKTVTVDESDLVVISASPVPGNEQAVNRVINRLSKIGVEVLHRGNAKIHVSGHAGAEELKLMLNMVKPKYFVPIHGETRHLRAHARLAEQVGVPHESIFVLDNGDSLELTAGEARLGPQVDHGVIYVDGLSSDVEPVVLRDRQHLARDGILAVVITIDAQTGKVVGDPELVARGVVLGGDDQQLIDGAMERVKQVLQRTASEGATDPSVVERAVRESLSRYLWENVRTRPMVIPVVMEV